MLFSFKITFLRRPITRACIVLCHSVFDNHSGLLQCNLTKTHVCQQQICNSLLIPLSSFSLCLSLFPWAILWIFLIPLLCDSCFCFIPPLLLFQSLVTSNLSFSLSLWPRDLHLLCSSCSVLRYRSSCHGNFSFSHSICWFFCGKSSSLHHSIPPPALSLLLPFPLSLYLARKSSFPPWIQQTPVWVLEENWPALLSLSESPNRTNPPPDPPWTESCPSR